MNITKINIGLQQSKESKWQQLTNVLRDHRVPIPFAKDEHHYLAEAIECEQEYFYRVDGITVRATQFEYENVIKNPRLYYFSSALKLHHRIRKAKELGIGYHWPSKEAAPIHIFDLGK
jgi:hypothetical protein